MDIGQGKNTMNARDLTAEIDRETEALVDGAPVQAESAIAERVENPGVSEARAQAIGRGAIFGGYEQRVPDGIATEVVEPARREVEAAVELSEDLNRIQHAEKFAGETTEVQRAEYAKEDMEFARWEETGAHGAFEAKVAYRNQEEVAKDVAPAVEKMMRQPKYELRELAEIYREGTRRTLATFDREIGARN